MSIKVDFAAGQALEQLLRELGNSAAVRRAGRAALREAAAPIIATAKALAPKELLNLEQSIKAVTGKRDKGDDGDQVFIVIGIDQNVDPPRDVPRAGGKGAYRDPGVAGNSVIQELGRPAEGIPANPFMRPSWDAHKNETPDRIGDALGPAIEREAKKLAKKNGA